jgi:hypothetical protein
MNDMILFTPFDFNCKDYEEMIDVDEVYYKDE